MKARTVKKVEEKKGTKKAARPIPPSLNYACKDIQVSKMFVAVKDDKNYEGKCRPARQG